MNTQSNAIPESHLEAQVTTPAVIPASRLLYWSVRRELWEYRSIYIAPLAVAGLFLFGFLIGMNHLRHRIETGLTLSPMQQQELVAQPYLFAALLIMGTTFLVAIFYCLDALHGERRDRSILFWKSLPVSDLTTVLSKASIPLVILPLLTFAVTVVTQSIMLLLSSAVLPQTGLSVATLWSQVVAAADVRGTALPPSRHSRSLVCANIRLAAAGVRLGAARGISLGCASAARHWHG